MNSQQDFQLALRLAGRRQKLHMAARMARKALPMTAGIAIFTTGLMVFDPQLFAGPARWMFGLLALALIVLLSIPIFARFSSLRAAKALDQDFGLPDSALAWIQLSTPGSWQDAMQNETLARLQSAVPPTQKSEKQMLSLSLLFVLTLVLASVIWFPALPSDASTSAEVADPAAFDEVLKDWENFAEKNAGPESREIEEAAETLKAALQDREATRQELLVRIATVEDRLKSQLSSATSLESLLPTLAKALAAAAKPTEAFPSGTPSASEALDQLASQLPDAFPMANASELEELARQLSESGHTQLAQALRELAGAMSTSQATSAIGKLTQSLSDAEAMANAKQMMELAMMQLAAAKEGTSGNSEGGLAMLPKLSDQDQPGVGAGDSTEFAESKSLKELNPAALLAPVNNASASEGETMVQVLPSEQGLRETPARSASNGVATMGPLSAEAISPEALPLVHRATVRKYFDAIRPKQQNP